jgi:hypothetical protein
MPEDLPALSVAEIGSFFVGGRIHRLEGWAERERISTPGGTVHFRVRPFYSLSTTVMIHSRKRTPVGETYLIVAVPADMAHANPVWLTYIT